MKRKTQTLLSLLFAAIFLFGYGLNAGPRHGKRDHSKHLTRMKKALKLTSEQEQKIKEIFKKYDAIRKKLHEEMKPAHEKLHELMLKEDASRSDVEDQLEEMSELRVKMRLTHFDQAQEISKVLNEAQRKKWRAIRKKHMQKRMERHKKRHSSGMDM